MSTELLIGLAAAIVVLGIFIHAVRSRWFGRARGGFLLAISTGIACVGLITAALQGLWSYQRGEQVLFGALVDGMRNQGSLVESVIQDNVATAFGNLERLSSGASIDGAQRDIGQAERILAEIQRFNPRFLQICIVDGGGAVLCSSSVKNELEPVNRVAIAFNLEGKRFASDPYVSAVFDRYVLYLSVPIRKADGSVGGALTSRYDIQDDLAHLIDSAKFGVSGYGVLTDPEGRILAHHDAARVRSDISSYPAVREALAGRTGWTDGENAKGTRRLFVYRPVRSVATIGQKPWALLTEMDFHEAMAPIESLRVQFLIGLLAVFVACLLVAGQVARSIRRPLHQLVEFVRSVRGGDLTKRVAIDGHDEIGQLAGALNEMVHGLQERDRVKEVFGRYLTTQVSEKILNGQVALGGERRRVTMLFSDIRDFTSLSEKLSPEQVVGFLNDYFSEMVEAVFEKGGVLDKFIGDGMLAVFGSLDEQPDHPRRAVMAALRMKALLGKINGERAIAGLAPINIGIGIHTADVIVGNIGSRKRLEYTVIGDGVNTCSRVESMNKSFGTTILVTEETHRALGEDFECREMPAATVKGKAKPLQLFEVVSLRQAMPA
ncbi:MAG: adenylate/guanylate cyclase domain-containing protein [Planctomycetes bacterium]|nr:adenylate/guanylate cyclase domain-containing protein [Planctomycetota bacterium]MBI3847301.1 adenylate/guanylate cyclase domain-containing protein [Planctomycetota bacterium]